MTALAKTLSKPLIDAILGLHALTGCDSTSCFSRKGKMKALKLVKNDERLTSLFARFGTSATVSDDDFASLEAFVCKLYGKHDHSSVDKVRYDIVRQSFKAKRSILSSCNGVDLSLMPPCSKVLKLHIQRANYQTLIWRMSSFSQPSLPKPEEYGWKMGESGLEIDWHGEDFVPKELLDIMLDDDENVNEDQISEHASNDEDNESDFDDDDDDGKGNDDSDDDDNEDDESDVDN